MATLPANAGHPTLVNWAKFLDPNGKAYKIAELLNQSNELMQYLPWIEGNLPTGHKASVRAGLPTVQFRRFYQGVAVSKSDRAIIEDTCAMQSGRSEVDCDLADLNGDAAAFRLSEAISFIEAQTQAAAVAFMYGDASTNKDGITGLTPRYNSLSASVNTSANIIDSGGTGSDNTSVWLLVLGPETITGIFPKGSKAGLVHKDLGEIDAFDNQTPPARYRAYAETWDWKFGLHVKDWRYAVRIANIDVSDLIARTGTQALTASTALLYTMIDALNKIPSMGMGTAVFLAGRTAKAALSKMAMDKSQNAVRFSEALDQFGKVAPGSVGGTGTGLVGGQLLFQSVPVLTVDKISSAETRVV